MKDPSVLPTNSRLLRFTGSLPALLDQVIDGQPLYLHARNDLTELAGIVSLGASIHDEAEGELLFPEDGLSILLSEVKAIHAVSPDHTGNPSLSIEVAIDGEPRRLTLLASPEINGMERFAAGIAGQPSEILVMEEYVSWKKEFTRIPMVCPCCKEAEEKRSLLAEQNPLAAIFRNAIDNRTSLRCELLSKGLNFSSWIEPARLRIKDSKIGLICENGTAMLQVDAARCHLLTIKRQTIDGEQVTQIGIHDSLAHRHMILSAKGWDKAAVWCQFFPKP